MQKFNPFPEYLRNVFYEGKNWAVQLHTNQAYLGRCVVYLTSRCIENPLQLTKEERDELWIDILPRLSGALQKAFQPDRINYVHLANESKHVHWHVVPRYENNPIRKFVGETFNDKRAGTNFAPEPQHILSAEVLDKIRAVLTKHFSIP